MGLIYKRGSLNFTADNSGGFICQELQALPEKFAAANADDKGLMQEIEEHINKFRNWFEVRFDSKEEHDNVPKEERLQRGVEIFDAILPSIRQSAEGLKSMEQFMLWFGDWWYYNPEIRRQLTHGKEGSKWIYKNKARVVKKYIMPLLPDQIRKNIENADNVNIAMNSGHFAMLFIRDDNDIRRIVTDTQLFELKGVRGYNYLDITPDGKPVARSVCKRGGGRAFFDGIRLKSHDMFQTCAPKTVMIKGGYKVNATKCTIVNGMLFELIDVDDKVAHTDGAFMGFCDFSNAEAIESYSVAEESGKLMRVEDDSVILRGEIISPIGVFMPSHIRLLENGFSRYDWSDFEKISGIRYSSVLVVDDSQEWLDQVQVRFGETVENLTVHLTSDKRTALAKIKKTNPQAVLLDMHLTSEEEFDGLWISRTLLRDGFKGKVMIASSYPEKHLRAMKVLIDDSVHIPGKNLAQIEKCLLGECRCKQS